MKKLVSKEATSEAAILKLSSQPAVLKWRHSVRLGLGQQNLFFQAIIHFTIFNLIISEFGACLAQNNVAQEQP